MRSYYTIPAPLIFLTSKFHISWHDTLSGFFYVHLCRIWKSQGPSRANCYRASSASVFRSAHSCERMIISLMRSRVPNVEADTFVQKLKKILVLFKPPSTEFPGIRRVTVQLIIWIMQNNKSYIREFVRCGLSCTK